MAESGDSCLEFPVGGNGLALMPQCSSASVSSQGGDQARGRIRKPGRGRSGSHRNARYPAGAWEAP